MDEANIISASTESRLVQELARLEADTHRQFVIVTTPSLEGQPIATWSIDLAREIGLGRQHHSDGIMLVVAPTERKVRVEVGCGLEAWLPDEYAAMIIREHMLPLFRESRLQDGIDAGAEMIIARLRSDPRDDETVAQDAREACPSLAD